MCRNDNFIFAFLMFAICCVLKEVIRGGRGIELEGHMAKGRILRGNLQQKDKEDSHLYQREETIREETASGSSWVLGLRIQKLGGRNFSKFPIFTLVFLLKVSHQILHIYIYILHYFSDKVNNGWTYLFGIAISRNHQSLRSHEEWNLVIF